MGRSTFSRISMSATARARWLALALSSSVLFSSAVHAQEDAGAANASLVAPTPRAPDNMRPVGITIAAAIIGADALFATAYGLYMLLEPARCVQQGPAGECLRTSTPSESYRIHGAVMVGVSAVLYATTIALSVLADEAWRAIAPAETHAALRPWLAADETTGIGGMVLAW
jgi:hypothetical protein